MSVVITDSTTIRQNFYGGFSMMKLYTDKEALLTMLQKRASSISAGVEAAVTEILDRVRREGDAAVRVYTRRFDGVDLERYTMEPSLAASIAAKAPRELYETMERAAANIYAYHEKQKQRGYLEADDQKIMGQLVRPLNRVAVYVPGGTAAYPSSVLMNVIPAKVAGVKEIVMLTPPKKEGLLPAVAAAAQIAGVTEILTVGGAQAVAACAFGTESIRRVDKIVGPGNIYVAMAKRAVYGTVDIDMVAGPSEVLIIADETANPKYLAADLLSQAEQDVLASAVLLTTSPEIAEAVRREVKRQMAELSRREIMEASVNDFGAVLCVDSLEEAAELSNRIAPEHLELAVKEPFSLLGSIQSAGSIFLGEFTPEPLGDYFAGPNHILPTNGTARFASPLSVDSFVKKSSYLCYRKEALRAAAGDVIRFAQAEGLTAHANAVAVRFPEEK